MARMILGILFFLLTCICISLNGSQRSKSKTESANKWLLAGIICFTIGLFFFHYGSCRLTMRRRLNEPVFSEEQLYGYKILNFSSSYDASKGMQYFIDIEDTISPYGIILKDVEVSEKFHLKYSMK